MKTATRPELLLRNLSSAADVYFVCDAEVGMGAGNVVDNCLDVTTCEEMSGLCAGNHEHTASLNTKKKRKHTVF